MSAPVTFWFETPTQAELRARLGALDAARHATHERPTWFCPLCPPPRGTAHPQTPAAAQEGEALPAAGHHCPTCGGTGVTDDGDRLCPECTGRGRR